MGKHRSFTPEFKAEVALEVLTGKKSAVQVCRERGLKSDLLSRWKMTLQERAFLAFQSEEQRSQELARIAELERLASRQALELEILKKASSLWDSPSSGSRR
jgi:transposase-like protein